MTRKQHAELRSRLARVDPMRSGLPVDPVTSRQAQELLERTMTTLDRPSEPAAPAPFRRPRWAPVAAAAAAVAAIGAGTVLWLGGGNGGPDSAQEPTTVALSIEDPGTTMGSCVPFSVRDLAAMPVALAGTVVSLDHTQVTLDVDRWYRGGTADRVEIAVPGLHTSAALDGVTFVVGERYLLAATDGVVNGCGFSGRAEPELEQSYEKAFGS